MLIGACSTWKPLGGGGAATTSGGGFGVSGGGGSFGFTCAKSTFSCRFFSTTFWPAFAVTQTASVISSACSPMLTRVPPRVFSLLRFDSIRLLNMRLVIRDGVREQL